MAAYAFIFLILVAAALTQSAPCDTLWSQAGGSAAHTSRACASGPTSYHVLWSTQLPFYYSSLGLSISGVLVTLPTNKIAFAISGPLVTSDGKTGSTTGVLLFDVETGKQLTHFNVSDSTFITITPASSPDADLFIPTDSNLLLTYRYSDYILAGSAPQGETATGTHTRTQGSPTAAPCPAWSFQTIQCPGCQGVFGSGPTVSGDAVFFSRSDGHVYALRSQDGGFMWRYPDQNGHFLGAEIGGPTVGEGLVFISAFYTPNFYAINASIGTLLWNQTVSIGAMINSNIAYDQGQLFFTTNDQKASCYNATTGALVWSVPVGTNWYGGPVVTDNTVYVCSFDSFCYALNRTDGALLWKVATPNTQGTPPGIIADASNILYVNTYSGHLIAFDGNTNGTLLFQSPPDTVASYSQPALAPSGILLAVSSNGTLSAFGRGPKPEV